MTKDIDLQMNKLLYFLFWGWGGASVLVSGRAGPCMLLHQLVLTTHTPRSQLVNKQNEYYRMCLQYSYLDIYGLISV